MADPIHAIQEEVWIRFEQGSLRITGSSQQLAPVAASLRWDERTDCYRAEARRYGIILLTLHQLRIPFRDEARRFNRQNFQLLQHYAPRPHQQEALDAWLAAKRQGVVVLPTGAGKTLVARLAIAKTQRDTLILVPTLDLMQQWHEQLAASFLIPIGLLGGGDYQLESITVSTYDSAYLRMEQIGDRFGLLICDECHHLPATTTRLAAIQSIAPFRLGLTATPERTDGQEADLYDLLGAICYRSEITDLEGEYLAPYRLEQIAVHLDPDERIAYNNAYAQYRDFVRSCGVKLSEPNGWSQFVQICHRSQEGRAAYRAYLLQKRLARASRAKLRTVWQLLRRHKGEQVLLFTDDNATAYAIGETFFLPVITHHTRISERKQMLDNFRSGELPFLVNSHVLNEGVDVPDVAVGIIVSGSGSVRAHVQRLGRILRPREGKQAILYELVSEGTAETFTSEKRRQHLAYQR
ncbi:DEAD/DEAH box helicase [Candidatus Magnetaquicoccus inordinatus]|uniref:DEAD/DEAH box helicase n=1 Tax=Candidatus Magnetaquicoccus inordinatus TaxID=2496818 RepID=UPI00102B59A7|nr:DEAD/DEAH box helicase family protein [Candidatus Magnetaquicoccus inordinatus]